MTRIIHGISFWSMEALDERVSSDALYRNLNSPTAFMSVVKLSLKPNLLTLIQLEAVPCAMALRHHVAGLICM